MMTLTRGIGGSYHAVAVRGTRPSLQVLAAAADNARVLRYFGIPTLLIAVFIGLYLTSQDAKSNAPSASDQQAIAQAHSAAAGSDFSQAVPVLQGYFDQNNTYVGATLPPGSGVVLAVAGPTSYCLQAGGEHEAGPGGQPAPGPC
jgi:hypothetical protein